MLKDLWKKFRGVGYVPDPMPELFVSCPHLIAELKRTEFKVVRYDPATLPPLPKTIKINGKLRLLK